MTTANPSPPDLRPLPPRPGPAAGGAPDPQFGNQFGKALQLTRASALSLTRLQLALAGGDRRRAMEEIDRLHTLDGEIEAVAARLHPGASDDPEWRALAGRLGDQKLALAFEKLALASGIDGPALASLPTCNLPLSAPARAPGEPEPAGPPEEGADAPASLEWPPLRGVEPKEWNPLTPRVIGVLLTLAVMVAVAVGVWVVGGL